ncbi:hypothetical protein NKR23_g10231 [Pleurostoma richardsiae]|uniref:Uncharacterized protein n=1 Tax=Pleurostoma richardsiae TaxID=41990 RepID=A0AA38RDC4_9PEZI|nr:hypothetical protein NKR23_g10231 [Pleurostoma richardsiae]
MAIRFGGAAPGVPGAGESATLEARLAAGLIVRRGGAFLGVVVQDDDGGVGAVEGGLPAETGVDAALFEYPGSDFLADEVDDDVTDGAL